MSLSNRQPKCHPVPEVEHVSYNVFVLDSLCTCQLKQDCSGVPLSKDLGVHVYKQQKLLSSQSSITQRFDNGFSILDPHTKEGTLLLEHSNDLHGRLADHKTSTKPLTSYLKCT